MKKITLVLLSLIFSLSVFSQNCVTDLRGGDFGLDGTLGEIVFIKVDPDGNKWFGINNPYGGTNGIGKFDENTWTEFAPGTSDLPGDHVWDIAFDTSGNVWVATKAGLFKFDGDSPTGWDSFNNVDFGITSSEVTSIAIDSGYVKWLGFATGEVIRYDDTTWSVNDQLTNKKIYTINVDSLHNIWIGMNQSPGMAMYDHVTWTTYPGFNSILSIQFSGASKVYASYFEGLHIYDGEEWTEIPGPGYSLYKIALNSNEDVWLSSSNGLVELRDTLFFSYTPSNSGIPEGAIFSSLPPQTTSQPSCAFDQEDNLWFGYQYSSGVTHCATGFLTENDGLGLEVQSDRNFVFCDGDNTVLDAGPGFSAYNWSTGETSDTIFVYTTDTINVAVTDGSGCWDYDTVTTFKHEVYDQEKICMVTVLGGNNLVVWERTQDKGTEFYNIYKETEAADEYEIIGTVPYTDLSVFIDPNSENKKRAERYKITAVDTCGNESDTSFHHKTMHLTLNVGLSGESNLIWENYEGIDFVSYAVFRGTRADNMEEFDVIPNNTTTYTDWEFGEFFYSIGVIMPDACSPALFLKADAGPYSHAISNIEDNRLQIDLPPSEIYISDSTILDGQPAGTFVGKFTTYDPDSTGTFEYSLVAGDGDTENDNFAISNDSLFSAAVLNYDVQERYSIRVKTTDSDVDTLTFEKIFTIKVLFSGNSTPTDISISNNDVDEGLPAGTFVGKFSTTDPDEGDTHTYTLVSGDGSTDNASFTISNDSLFTDAEFNYDEQHTNNIRVRTTDDGSGHKSFDKQFVINITEVTGNMAPTDIALSSDNLDEKLPEGTLIGRFSTTDDGDIHEYDLVEGEGDDDISSFTITGDSLLSGAEFDYTTKNSYSIRVRSTDEGSLYFEKSFVILVNSTGIDQARKDLRIFPVPATNLLTIEFPYQAGQDYKLVITDLNGRRIKMMRKINSGSIEIDASDLAPGIYILELRGPVLLRSRIVKTN